MEITRSIDGDTAVLGIAGRIDFATSETVEQTAAATIAGGGRRLIFDLRAVDYISSAGLRSILVAAKQAKSAGGGVAVFGLQAGVAEVFNASGFGKIVPVVATAAEARAKLTA